jgi:superfamily I DNA/RNA helicase
MAKLMHRPILVLCYNVALAARLKSMLQGQGIDDRVNVYSIHSWANTILKTYHFQPPAVVERNYDAAIDLVIEKVRQGHIPRGQYGAILIDEGHDFEREWLRLVVDMVDPETNSVLLLYDDTQSIYKRSSSLGFSLKDVGIEAQGRTTILRLNYRNTEQILNFAFDFIDDYVKPTEEGDDKLPIVAPNTCGRKGSLPEVWSFPSFEAEAAHIAAAFARAHKEREIPWSDMGALYCHKWMGKALADAMTAASVPFTWLQDSASKHRLDMAHNSVKLITMHSSKGLEFRTVATCGIGSLGLDSERTEEDAKLLYVAMTRATEDLLITSSKESPFALKLQEMAAKHRGARLSR